MGRYSFPAGESAESIATALTLLTGLPVRKDQVVVEPYDNIGGQYLITVYETAEFATRIIPFLDEHGSIPTSMGELCPVGYKTNRELAGLDLRQHGQIVGGTTSGKTSLLHVILAHATRCPDCVIWIGGVWKLYNFVGPWLLRYQDTGVKPPFDWIANGHQDVCNMMAAFLNISDYRMNLRIDKRVHLPYMILVLDEVTYITNNRLVKGFVNGEWLTSSALIAAIARGTAESGLYEILATQRDTQDNLGDAGGTTSSQMGYAFVFRIRDPGTVGRVTGNHTLPTPKNNGECWADLGPGVPVVKLRVPYPQSPDPRKDVLHNGPTVADISWARRHIPHVLDDGSADTAGEHYAARHQLVTEEYLDYLTTTKRTAPPVAATGVAMNSLSSPATQAELAEAELYFNRMVTAKLDSGSQVVESNGHSVSATTEATEAVTELAGYQTRKAKVLAIVQAAEEPISRGGIIEVLEKAGDRIKHPNSITNICGEWCRTAPPAMFKTDDDKYYVA